MTRARLLFLSPALLLCLAASAGAQTSSGREALLKAVQELRNHELSTPGLPPAFVAHYTEALDEIQGRVEGASSGQDLAKAGKDLEAIAGVRGVRAARLRPPPSAAPGPLSGRSSD
ncbi:MAG: hypothetical protein NTX64_19090 [Elusimicrobia bacterium]|nr:hypothetical protein [Elusimicrobiota bacterium]